MFATWYCKAGVSRCTIGYPPSCYCAAASPDLHLQGRTITVCRASLPYECVRVKVIDVLASRPHGLDLYAIAFSTLAPLTSGVVTVQVRS